jgi:hypothetical protein
MPDAPDPHHPADPDNPAEPDGSDHPGHSDNPGPDDPADPNGPGDPAPPPDGSNVVDVVPGEVTAAGVVPERVPAGDQDEAPNVKAEHGGPRVPDRAVAWRIFAAIGGFVVVLAVLYWFTSYEDAGSVLLALSAVLSLWFGTYLWLQQRRPEQEADASQVDAVSGALYLPHASIWPLVIGLGAASVANGLVLGTWVIVPGVAALALGIGGFVRQSRRRD